MNPELTARGKRLATAILALALLAVTFLDIAIGFAASFLLVLLLVAYIDSRRKKYRSLSLRAGRDTYRTIAGEKFRLDFDIESNGERELSRVKFTLPEAPKLEFTTSEGSRIGFEGYFQHPGLIEVSYVMLEYPGLLHLFVVESAIPVGRINITVYPRFVVPLSRFAGYEIIEMAEGESNLFRISNTGEYASTRDYQPGDELKNIDWKATARLQTYKVKEFVSPYSYRANLIFDVTASDIISADILASEFFSTLLSFANTDVAISASLYDGQHFINLKPRQVIEELTEASLQMLGRFSPDIGRILDLPLPNRNSLRASQDASEPDYSPGKVIAITQLLSDLIDRLLVLDDVKTLSLQSPNRNLALDTVIQPTSPWLTVESIEDAYLIKRQIEKIQSNLERYGIRVISPSNLAPRHELLYQLG
ncbi:MAG: DUF58 domain-containing protein [Conexivisphaerales archaeon]